jgi:hypothetical protein
MPDDIVSVKIFTVLKARSSVVERYPDTVEVISSSLIAPTRNFKGLQALLSANPFFVPFAAYRLQKPLL